MRGGGGEEGSKVGGGPGRPKKETPYQRTADMRYVGQGHEVSVRLLNGVLGEQHVPQITAEFEETYRSLYGRKGPDVALEIINWRVVASGPPPETRLQLPRSISEHSKARKGQRPAYFPESGGFVETAVYDRYAFEPGTKFDGPAIVEERESTLILGPRGAVRERLRRLR